MVVFEVPPAFRFLHFLLENPFLFFVKLSHDTTTLHAHAV
jgi:hypothetical protein